MPFEDVYITGDNLACLHILYHELSSKYPTGCGTQIATVQKYAIIKKSTFFTPYQYEIWSK